jgi:hypothetical protein
VAEAFDWLSRIRDSASACCECRYEGPADRAVGAESAGAGVLGEAAPSTSSMKVRRRMRRPNWAKDVPTISLT